MKEETKKPNALIGRVAMAGKSCNMCNFDGNCLKIDVNGIGQLCLVGKDDLAEKYESLQEESAVMSGELTDLRKKLEGTEKAFEEKAAELNEANSDIRILEHSNKHMEEELKRQRAKADDAVLAANKARQEIVRLMNRGLIDRIFNR